MLLLALLLSGAFRPPAYAEPPGRGVIVDASTGTIEAPGSCAADLRAPSAEVARIKAERIARERARERLKQALLSLPPARLAGRSVDPAAVDAALQKAEVASVHYGSTGSVTVRLRLRLEVLGPAQKRSP